MSGLQGGAGPRRQRGRGRPPHGDGAELVGHGGEGSEGRPRHARGQPGHMGGAGRALEHAARGRLGSPGHCRWLEVSNI